MQLYHDIWTLAIVLTTEKIEYQIFTYDTALRDGVNIHLLQLLQKTTLQENPTKYLYWVVSRFVSLTMQIYYNILYTITMDVILSSVSKPRDWDGPSDP